MNMTEETKEKLPHAMDEFSKILLMQARLNRVKKYYNAFDGEFYLEMCRHAFLNFAAAENEKDREKWFKAYRLHRDSFSNEMKLFPIPSEKVGP